MPGTPATSPRVGAPRYTNTDASDFAGQVNGITDAFDAKVGIFLSGLASARPPAAIAERYYYATDTGELTRDTGSAWTPPLNPRSIATVTSLPGTPYDGQIIDYLADATNGIVWRLRYRAASASAFKWEFLGGQELGSETTTAIAAITTTAYSNPGGLPSIVVPLAGDYVVKIYSGEMTMASGAGGTNRGFLSYSIGATAPADGDGMKILTPTASTAVSAAQQLTRKKAGLAAATTLQMQGKVLTGGTLNPNAAVAGTPIGIAITPIRVG